MEYEYWFAAGVDLSNRQKRLLRQEYNSAKELYYIEETHLRRNILLTPKEADAILKSRKTWELHEKYERLETDRINLITWLHPAYPKRLREIHNPPYALYVRGQLPAEEKFAIAIVGARNCSSYGETMAREYAQYLGAGGIEIISGMARGVDGAAGRGALNAGGGSYAVLGCGVDICYPREHIGLYTDLRDHGGLISEQPPGSPPLPSYFPARNRIISGLADAVLVMEAKEKSGSLITADMALEQSRDVFALPGPVGSVLSKGCHRLIKQGAGILISPQELLLDLQILASPKVKKITKNKIILESAENMVYSCLDLFPKSLQQVIDDSKLPAAEVMNALVSLEIKGYIQEKSKNYYIKRA